MALLLACAGTARRRQLAHLGVLLKLSAKSEPFDPNDLDSSKPLVLLLGGVNHEGVVSALATAGRQYKVKHLDSQPENWRKIASYFQQFKVKAVVVKLSGHTYERLALPAYKELATELLQLIASVPNAVFVYEALLSGRQSEDSENFHQPSSSTMMMVNGLLDMHQVNLLSYKRNAQVTTIAVSFLADVDGGLLFRVYVPSGRIYANEVDRLLQLFRDYLARSGRASIRLSQFRTDNGVAYEFHGEQGAKSANLAREFDDFSHLLDLCVSDPHAAEAILRSKHLDPKEVIEVLTRYGKEAKRLLVDLKHERERKLLDIRHRLESELVESAEPASWNLIARLVDSTILLPDSISSIGVGTSGRPMLSVKNDGRPNVTFNISAQTIETVNNAIAQEILGNGKLSPEDQKILELVRQHGGDRSQELTSAVHEIADKGVPTEDQISAGQKVKAFLLKMGGKLGDAGIDILKAYIEGQLGL